MIEIAEIRIYPVKGLRGLALDEAEVEPWGLEHDRRWMIVDPNGHVLTQRQVPRMALIGALPTAGGLLLSFEGSRPFEVEWPEAQADTIATVVWRDVVEAAPASGADRWLSSVLATPCRLVYMAEPAVARPVDPDFGAAADRVSFADGFPLLVTNLASLDDLAGRLGRAVSMDRFRANLVIRGAEPWAEDRWDRLRVGRAAFAAVKDCARCVVTTVDQDTGLKAEDAEPLRSLTRFRRKAGGRIIFGQNLVPRGLGRIRVGDRVDIDAEDACPTDAAGALEIACRQVTLCLWASGPARFPSWLNPTNPSGSSLAARPASAGNFPGSCCRAAIASS